MQVGFFSRTDEMQSNTLGVGVPCKTTSSKDLSVHESTVLCLSNLSISEAWIGLCKLDSTSLSGSCKFHFRKSFGDEERMLMLYFNRIGWPTSLPTTEKESFLKRVMREKKTALDDLVISKAIPLRPGAEDFIDDALEKSIRVVMLTACSKIGEEVARTIVGELGSHRVSKMKIIGEEEVKQSLYGQLVLSKDLSSDLGEQLAEEANKAVPAEEVANTPSSQCFESIVAALQAGAECAETPVKKCIVVAGSHSVVSAAERIGMVSIVVRSSMTARAEFAGAKAVMDGFGGSDLSVSMVHRMQNL